jgi:hypothetical protein
VGASSTTRVSWRSRSVGWAVHGASEATGVAQSVIEETLQRIEKAPNVTGFVIMDDAGNVLRYRADKGEEEAKILASAFQPLLKRCQSAVRDLDPVVSGNGLTERGLERAKRECMCVCRMV